MKIPTQTQNARCLLNTYKADVYRAAEIRAENILHHSRLFVVVVQASCTFDIQTAFPPIKITWAAKSENLRLLTNGAVLPTPPVFSQCQMPCLDKTIYLYHFQARWRGPGAGGVERWRVRGKVIASLLSEVIDQPGWLLVSEVRPGPPGALWGWALSVQSCIEPWPKWRLIEGNGYWRPNHSETPSVTLKPVHSVNVRSRGTHLTPSADH